LREVPSSKPQPAAVCRYVATDSDRPPPHIVFKSSVIHNRSVRAVLCAPIASGCEVTAVFGCSGTVLSCEHLVCWDVMWHGVMQFGGALRRDDRTAVADRTAVKISVLLCKTPCCLVDDTGASLWTSSVVTFTTVRSVKNAAIELCLCTVGRTCYCSVVSVQSHSLGAAHLRATCDGPPVGVVAGVSVDQVPLYQVSLPLPPPYAYC
jgi:hypothetical protein